MKKKISKILFLFFACILLIGVGSASCNSSQININTASVEELQGITQIGPSRAQQIISLRPFSSVDDLSRVSGIGNGTRLNQIKSEGLACVGDEDYEEEEEQPQNQTQEEPEKELPIEEDEEINTEEIKQVTTEIVNLTPINLAPQNSKDIKSEDNKEILKRILSFCGITTLGVIFGALILLKRQKNKNKNEFRQ